MIALFLCVGSKGQEEKELRELCFKLGDADPRVKWSSAWALVKAGKKAVPIVSGLLDGTWVQGKRMAVWVLGQIRDPSVLPHLAKALGDPDRDVRWKSAVALKKRGESAVPYLIEVLRKGDLNAKLCSAWALGEIRSTKAVHELGRALNSANAELRWKSAISLKNIGTASISALEDTLNTGNAEARRCAIWVLGELGAPRSLPLLRRAVKDPDEQVRLKTVSALLSIGGDEAVKLLRTALRDDSVDVKREAIIALSELLPSVKVEPKVLRTGEVVELALKDEGDELTAIAFSPSGEVLPLHAFRDGDWRIRFSPNEEGKWGVLLSLDSENSCASFECKGVSRRTPLSLSKESPHTFTAHGRRIYLICLKAPRIRTEEEMKEFVSRAKALGANCISVAVNRGGGISSAFDRLVRFASLSGLYVKLDLSFQRSRLLEESVIRTAPFWNTFYSIEREPGSGTHQLRNLVTRLHEICETRLIGSSAVLNEVDFIISSQGVKQKKPVLRQLARIDQSLWSEFWVYAGVEVAEIPKGVEFDLLRSFSTIVRQVMFWELNSDNGVVLDAPRGAFFSIGVSAHQYFLSIQTERPGGKIKLGLPAGAYEVKWFHPETARVIATKKGVQTEGAVDLELPRPGRLHLAVIEFAPS